MLFDTGLVRFGDSFLQGAGKAANGSATVCRVPCMGTSKNRFSQYVVGGLLTIRGTLFPVVQDRLTMVIEENSGEFDFSQKGCQVLAMTGHDGFEAISANAMTDLHFLVCLDKPRVQIPLTVSATVFNHFKGPSFPTACCVRGFRVCCRL